MVCWQTILKGSGVVCVLTAVSAFSAREPDVKPGSGSHQAASREQQRVSKEREAAKLWKASALMGMRLENLYGQRLGTLKDFALDMRSGQARYAIVSSSGALGLRKEVRAVPPQFISAATAKRETLAAHLTLEQWRNAPTFRLRDLPKLAGRQQASEIDAFYAQIPTDPLTTGNRAPMAVAVPLKPTGRDNVGRPDQDEHPQLDLASRLIGKDVTNPQREDIGQVSDLLLDLSAPERVFALVSTGRFLRRHETYAVPFRSLSLSAAGKKLVLNVARSSLGQAPLLTREAWNEQASPGQPRIFRYDERNPLNR